MSECVDTFRRVRVVAWNLRHGGGNTRTPEQALFLQSLAPDVVALSEVREARGSQLRSMLADAGLTNWIEPKAASTRNHVVIASRFALTAIAKDTWRERFVAASIEQFGIAVFSVHVPDENNETARAEVWQLVVEQARSVRDSRAIIAGDFNTQRTGVKASAKTTHLENMPTPNPSRPQREGLSERIAWRGGKRVGQTCERMMGMLATHGYVDVTCPSVSSQQPTWFGPTGERHAIDGIWASKPLILASSQCGGQSPSAFRETRCVEENLSDHAAIGVDFHIDFDPKNSAFREVGGGAKAGEGGLFA